MADLFDGLAAILADPDTGFGEPVVYIPIATGIPLGAAGSINAIWNEDHLLDGLEPRADSLSVRVDVLASDVAAPQEGDTVQRVKTGKTGTVFPPIAPDGHGLILLTLQKLS